MNHQEHQLLDPIQLNRHDQVWLGRFARKATGLGKIETPTSGTLEEILKMAKETYAQISSTAMVANFLNNLASVEETAKNNPLPEQMRASIAEFRRRIEEALQIQRTTSNNDPESPEIQERRRTRWVPYMLGPSEAADNDTVEDGEKMRKMITGLQHWPLWLLLTSYYLRGTEALENIIQSTEQESLRYAPKGSDRNEAIRVGYPLPKELMLQRDFLQIDERKKKLEELRVAGDLDALAAYEKDCYNAIYATIMGLKPAEIDRRRKLDNTDLTDLSTSRKRGCGGASIQIAYWLRQLDLKAFVAVAQESGFGTEGHFSFITKNAKGELYYFDPALRVHYRSIPKNFYTNPQFEEEIANLDSGIIDHLQLRVVDSEDAYRHRISPIVTVQTIERAHLRLLHEWNLENGRFGKKTKERMLEKINQRLGNNITADPTFNYLEFHKAYELVDNGEHEEAKRILKEIRLHNPDGVAALFQTGLAFVDIGQTGNAMVSTMSLLRKTIKISQIILETIEHEEKTECQPGKLFLPICHYYEVIRSGFRKCIELLTMCIISLGGVDQESLRSLDSVIDDFAEKGHELFALYLQTLADEKKYLMQHGGNVVKNRRTILEHTAGKVTLSYVDFKSALRNLNEIRKKMKETTAQSVPVGESLQQ